MSDPAATFRRIEQVFHAVRDCAASERTAVLDGACAGDESLRGEVEALLREHDEAGPDSEVSAVIDVDLAQLRETTTLPERIGRYRILEMIGEGGMGIVYRARQSSPDRTVALKVIKTGFTTTQMLRRFELEAQLLGRLRHPGIAQVYEAGVDRVGAVDVPFIAMEMIDGVPLLRHVRTHRPDRRARLELAAQICEAVHHAHQHGVIHRDLKPGNILVERRDGVAVPRIVDFGVAQATDGDTTTIGTSAGQLLGTLRYMSPEQAAGDPLEIDARSDVYALGVILYELLADRPPHDVESVLLPEAIRMIRETEPASLSSISRALRGDLDTIVRKAIAKEKPRRYQSAAELGADLRRFLRREPISAHPPSAAYQMRRFAQRNRTLVATASAFVVLLLSATVVTSWLAITAGRERARAERRFDDVHELATVFLFDFDARIRDLPGSLPAREFIVETGLEYLDRLQEDAGEDPNLLRELADGYLSLGDIQGGLWTRNVGDTAGAAASCEKAIAILEPLAATGDADADALLHDAAYRLGTVYNEMNRQDDALAQLDRARAWAENRLRTNPEDGRATHLLSRVFYNTAIVLRQQDRIDEGLAALERSHELVETLHESNPALALHRREIAVDHFQFGIFSLERDDWESALDGFRRFVEEIETLQSEHPEDEGYRRDLASGLERVAETLTHLGRTEEAIAPYERGLALAEARLARAPNDAEAMTSVFIKASRLGEIELARGDIASATARFDRSLALARRRAEMDRDNTRAQRALGVAYYKQGELNAMLGGQVESTAAARIARWGEARVWFERCDGQFAEMAERGLLWTSDAGVRDDIAQQIRTCEDAAASLAAP